MNTQKYLVAAVGLGIVGAGTWWVTSGGGSPKATITNEPQPETPSTVVDVTPPAPQHAIVQSAPEPGTQEASSVASPTAPAERREKREFEARADMDPALSRELQTVVQRSVDATLDRSRMDMESLICRGNSCQILFTPQAGDAAARGMPEVSAILRDLNEASVQNPSTGAQLKPMVQMISAARDGNAGIVAVIAFEPQ